MEKSIRIDSSQSNASLLFSGIEGDSFGASFRVRDTRAAVRVWGYADAAPLVDLFRSIARDWRGWDGSRSWRSPGGEIRLSCTSDRLGHVTIEVAMVGIEKPEAWKFAGTLVVDPGQLDRIANEVQGFFAR